MKLRQCEAGFTLVEAVIGFLIITLLSASAYKVFSFVLAQRNRGSVDLEELQGARTAINYLRRDFRCAAPLINEDATMTQRKKSLKIPVIEADSFDRSRKVTPIVVSGEEIHFFKHNFATLIRSEKPKTEQINYRIDKARGCLVRTGAGSEKVFKDIKAIKFELYSHPLFKETPMLLVTMKVDANKGDRKDQKHFFEISTTISSSMANHNINYEFWNSHSEL